MIDNLERGEISEIGSNFIYNVASAAVSVQKIGGCVNSFFYKVDKEKCVRCGLCVRNCPEKNIRLDRGKIKFGHRCDMCMRCSFFCPTNAVRIGFLEGWKVNGDYRLSEIFEDTSPRVPYIDENSRGFYKCFIPYFARIDAEYAKKFKDD